MAARGPTGWRRRTGWLRGPLAESAALVLPLLVGMAALVTLFWIGHLGVRRAVERNELLSEAEARVAAAIVNGSPPEADETVTDLLAAADAVGILEALAGAAAERSAPVSGRLDAAFRLFGRERAELADAAETRFLQLNALGGAALVLGAGASFALWRRRWRQRWRRVERLCEELEALGERPFASASRQRPGGTPPRNDELGRLEAAVAQLGSRVADAFVHQQRLAQLGEHVAFIAHDLRNPLSAIAGGLSLMHRTGAWDPELGPLLVDESHRMTELVQQLRDFGRASERPQRCDLREEVDVSVRLARRRADAAGVNVRAEHGPAGLVWARPNELRQVVLNLVENAIDAARGSERASVAVRTRAAGDWVELVVEDSGPGVPEAERGRIFEPFVTGKPDGSGMGLAIARRIVERLGGRIEVGGSRELGGAAFRVLLPAAEAAAEQEERGADRSARSPRPDGAGTRMAAG